MTNDPKAFLQASWMIIPPLRNQAARRLIRSLATRDNQAFSDQGTAALGKAVVETRSWSFGSANIMSPLLQ